MTDLADVERGRGHESGAPRRGVHPIIVLLAALVLVAVSVVAWKVTHPSTAHRNVVVMGDSITFLGHALISQELGDNFQVTASGINGARSDERVRDADALAAQTHASQLIINLGTNDVMQATPPDQSINAVTTIASRFTEARCIHLVTISEGIFSMKDPEVNARAAQLNARFEALAAERGWNVIQWDDVVRDYGANGERDGSISSDTVHPTPLGQQMLIEEYDAALERC